MPSSTTRQAVAAAYGSPTESVEVRVTEIPALRPGDVLIRVGASGVNPFDAKQVRGQVGADPDSLPLPLGGEAAGTVAAADADSGFAIGDEVVVYPARGAFAEYLVAPSSHVYRRPAGLGVEQAAGLLLAGVTAADILATLAVSSDDVLLVHGGAGAVGSIVVARAVAVGATVIATASSANHAYLRSLGAIPVGYDGDLLATISAAAPAPVTAVADTVGRDDAIDASLAVVAPERIVSIAAWGRTGDGIVVVSGGTEESRRHRRAAVPGLLDDAAAGRILIEIAGVYPLDDTAGALEAVGGRHPRGKLLIVP